MNNPETELSGYQADKNSIFSLIKISGFQAFLLTSDAEHRGILLI